MIDNFWHEQVRLKDIIEKGAREKEQKVQAIDKSDLTPHGHEGTLKGNYKSSAIPGRARADIGMVIKLSFL